MKPDSIVNTSSLKRDLRVKRLRFREQCANQGNIAFFWNKVAFQRTKSSFPGSQSGLFMQMKDYNLIGQCGWVLIGWYCWILIGWDRWAYNWLVQGSPDWLVSRPQTRNLTDVSLKSLLEGGDFQPQFILAPNHRNWFCLIVEREVVWKSFIASFWEHRVYNCFLTSYSGLDLF